jgi:murein DD-endopeptidase MepM/ murein hydrolase activator NlpD
MNIILLSKFCSKKGSIDLCVPRAASWLLVGAALFGGGLFWAGYQLAGSQGVADADQQVRELLAAERRAVETARDEARAHLDALALRIANLRAHLMRLDALGERLVQVGNLDGEEFDFSAEPPLGGDTEGPAQPQAVDELVDDMQRLSQLLDDRERKLLLLEDLLMSRELRSEVLPSGRPVLKGWISSGYGKRTDPFSGKKSLHHGVDFAGKRGTDVVAVAGGVVTRAEKMAGYGNLVEIRHVDGYSTRYAHNQENLVNPGQVVKKGEVIALLGSSGRSSGPHVHFEVRKDGRSINPRKFIQAD